MRCEVCSRPWDASAEDTAMDQEEGLKALDNIVTQFNAYEDFLDSQITTVDLYYLEDETLARQLVELGYRGTGERVKREDFEARKAAIEIARLAERAQQKTLTSAGKDLQDNFLTALAMREEDNRSGKLSLNQQETDAAHTLKKQLAVIWKPQSKTYHRYVKIKSKQSKQH
ncbi:cilia- and flagella-associated protein 299 isoform X3 [Homo sapiens]|uniref:cilia- and flagella-associated protein 299 isoform X3 n=1 Tax=Homo sapiens TaxID=9606 RepID=UPI0023DF4EB6|nr:cilia- and flagella-associated protein 299 isoform X3 [Homo sapiens]